MKWFAMGAPYRNEMKVFRALSDLGIECFLPVCNKIVKTGKRIHRQSGLLIGNLIFVHAEEEFLSQVKPKIERLQYKVHRVGDRSEKVIVPDLEMENFIRFIRCLDEETPVISSQVCNIAVGDRIKVVGGKFDGIEGYLVKVLGRRSKVLCVSLDGLISALVEFSPENIRPVSK